ncbi:MAG: HEAT repeat domain-containing protein [Verrucomicrobiota bacterium]|nr:HEAT repeat domain-containing protein [Limisphaera sp.]MDW8382854.1 HEAT repeat domain-containing protein [Verrucomicrobiota bacterium]
MKAPSWLQTLAWAVALVGCASPAHRPPVPQSSAVVEEQHPVEILQRPDADLKSRQDAFRALAQRGSPTAISALAMWLTNDSLSHMALYALEPMPGDAVDAALRDALAQAHGRSLLGIVTTLGRRRDPLAVPLLVPLLQSQDPELQRAAAHALGEIGTAQAANALWEAWIRVEPAKGHHLAAGLLQAAERQMDMGMQRRARNIYQSLYASTSAPTHVRAAALRGLLVSQRGHNTALWQEALHTAELALFHAALHAAQELPDSFVTHALARALPHAAPERQSLLIQALAIRRGPVALRAIVSLTNSPEAHIRLSAVRALGEMGDAQAIPALLAWINHADTDCRDAARIALASLPDPLADLAILQLLDQSNESLQLAGLDLVHRRRLASALPRIERMVTSENQAVRRAALKQIGELGNRLHWRMLVTRLRQIQSAEDLAAIQEALLTLASRTSTGAQEIEVMLAALNGATPAQASVLYTLLSQFGGEKGLRMAATTVRSGPLELRPVAFQALLKWRDPAAAEVLGALAEEAADPRLRQDALRRYLQWASDPELPAERRLQICRKAQRLIQDPADAKQFLAAVSTLTTPEVIPLARPLMNEPATREEACVAIVRVAERLRTQNPILPEPVRLALEAVIRTTQNAELSERARTLQQPQS